MSKPDSYWVVKAAGTAYHKQWMVLLYYKDHPTNQNRIAADENGKVLYFKQKRKAIMYGKEAVGLPLPLPLPLYLSSFSLKKIGACLKQIWSWK